MTRLVLALALLFFIGQIPAQNGPFDYQREEQLSMSHNGVPYLDARLLTFGGHPFMAPTPLAALVNPAALPQQTRISLALSQTVRSALQFWGINEGLISITKPVNQGQFSLGSAAATIPFKGLTLGLGYAETGIRAFPSFLFENIVEDLTGSSRYRYQGDLSGTEKTWFLAVQTCLPRGITLGVTLSRSSTRRHVLVDENWSLRASQSGTWVDEYRLEQEETHQMDHWTWTTGIKVPLSNRFLTGLSLILPFTGRVDRAIVRSLTLPVDNQRAQTFGADEYKLPPELHLSAVWQLPLTIRNLVLRSGLNCQYRRWLPHRFIFFGQNRGQELRDTLSTSLSLAAALTSRLGIFDLGGALRFDPQPLTNPEAAVLHSSGGLSWRDKWLEVDLALAILSSRPGEVVIRHLLLTCSMSILL